MYVNLFLILKFILVEVTREDVDKAKKIEK